MDSEITFPFNQPGAQEAVDSPQEVDADIPKGTQKSMVVLLTCPKRAGITSLISGIFVKFFVNQPGENLRRWLVLKFRLASANIEADEDGWNDDIRNFQKAGRMRVSTFEHHPKKWG